MVLSMTGYGKSVCNFKNIKLTVEIKSLNSKSMDIYTRLPQRYRNRDLELRKLINDKLFRGKVDFSISLENLGEDANCKMNKNTILSYISDLESLNIEGSKLDFLKMAVRMPEVFLNDEEEIDEEEWKHLIACVEHALSQLVNFRKTEGICLEKSFVEQIEKIASFLKNVETFEKERIDNQRERLLKQLEDLKVQFDEQRFHQEMIYYIEKLDITEEKTRLNQHIKYFYEVMAHEDNLGKKLGFIAQEMGREINTIGSKANHSEIQKNVVLMKDELEKIKEQINNVL